MDEQLMARLDETVVTLEFALKDVNALLNALNMPNGTPTIVFASFIQAIQQQAGPQADKAAELGLTPLARVHTVALAGVDPVTMLTGPIPATTKILDKAGMTLDDIDLVDDTDNGGDSR